MTIVPIESTSSVRKTRSQQNTGPDQSVLLVYGIKHDSYEPHSILLGSLAKRIHPFSGVMLVRLRWNRSEWPEVNRGINIPTTACIPCTYV